MFISREMFTKTAAPSLKLIVIIICPIAIAYSMGQIIKRFASVCVSVCVCVCPSVGTLTVAFLDRFSPKLART